MALTTTQAGDQLKVLQKANDDRLVKQGNGSAAVAFAKDVKSSLLFQYDWGELLSAAPMCISLMGSCYVAAGSPKATGLSLKDCEPTGGFKKIQNPELRACLIQVSDTGRFAFIEAEKKMDLIASTSQSLGQYLTRIGQYLGQLPDKGAEMALNDNIENLKEGSDNCLRYAQDVENKFKSWLELVCEVHQVTVAKDEKTSIVQKNTEIEIGGVSIQAELTEKSAKDAEEAAKNLKQNMDESRELFKKAAGAIPSPLESVGIQLVASLGQSVTSAISQGLMAMLSKFGGIPPAPQQSDGTNGNSGGKQRGGRPKTLGQANTYIADADDPAYRVADQANVMATLLTTILGVGTATGVDWDYLYPEAQAGGQAKGGLTLIDTTLKYIQDNTKWSQGSASTSLKTTISQLLEITRALKAEAAKDGSLNAKADASSPVVQDWQKKASDGKSSILSLVATMSSMPGAAPGSAPFIGAKPRASGQPDAVGVNSALQSAQEKARLTEAAYTSAQANYAKSVENRSKSQADLARIKAHLQSLTLQNAGLEEIRQILRQCIGTLIQMKAQITNLVLVFSYLSAMVEHVVKENVKDFMRQAETAQKCILSGVSLLDMARSDLFTTTLMIQAYFSLCQSVVNMYKDISVQWIQPGIRMCDEMCRTAFDPRQLIMRLKQLNEFTTSAQDAVHEKVQEFQKRTMGSLQDRIDIASQQIKLLPAPTPAVKAAIEDGTERITEAVEEGLAANQNGIVAGVEMSLRDTAL